jgi:putative transposase
MKGKRMNRTIDQEVLNRLLEGMDLTDPQAVLGEAGIIEQLKKAIAERGLNAELTHHLASQTEIGAGEGKKRNHRNGTVERTIRRIVTHYEMAKPNSIAIPC